MSIQTKHGIIPDRPWRGPLSYEVGHRVYLKNSSGLLGCIFSSCDDGDGNYTDTACKDSIEFAGWLCSMEAELTRLRAIETQASLAKLSLTSSDLASLPLEANTALAMLFEMVGLKG